MARPRAETPTFSLALRDGRYVVQWWENGAKHRVSCRTGQLPAAKRFLAEFEAGRAAPIVPECPTVGDVLDGYWQDHSQRPVSPGHIYTINTLKTLLAALPVDLLNKERVRNYLATRRAAGPANASTKYQKTVKPLADSTLRREMVTLRAALRWAEREGWITEVPHVEAPSAGQPRDRWLTRDEAARLIANARQAHVKLFIALGLYTAGRAGAVLELTWDRVDFDAAVIDLGSGRGNKRRAAVPLHPKVRPMLDAAFAVRKTPFVIEHDGKRVASAKKGFRAAAERAGVPWATPHVLRHTAATWMAQRGVSVERIAAFLGNSVAMVERVYVHHSPQHMSEASAALGD